ncbi:MAG: helix-turn-helix transcriptional regulator [Gammaproteobacteria bacterium]|nr:helix-turn-helix transcriptional regulator [Gammaproteobacteria bacterium]MDH5650595.1 helix-turn-helix transcriptional regulator [Gammaproteobacteria bacterium]
MANPRPKKLSGSEMGDILDPARPILTDFTNVDHPHRVQPHSHQRGQLVYACSGHMQVTGPFGHWYVSPQQAVWIPTGYEHAIQANTAIHYRSLFIDPVLARRLPVHRRPVQIPALLRELIRTAAEFGAEYTPDSAESRLITVMLDQVGGLQTAGFHVPLPVDRRLQVMVQCLLENPADERSLAEWAALTNVSPRTLERRIQSETGLGFRDWQQHLKVAKAVQLLQNGASVTTTALELGYAGLSAFSTMFRRITCSSPSRWLRQHA